MHMLIILFHLQAIRFILHLDYLPSSFFQDFLQFFINNPIIFLLGIDFQVSLDISLKN